MLALRIFLLSVLILISVFLPALGLAQTNQTPGMEGMQMPSNQQPSIPAGRAGAEEHPKPIEQPADNSFMALIAFSVFALPVVIWFFNYFSRKSRQATKNKKD